MDRIQLRLALACAALLGLAACGDDDMPMIMFPDSGMADAGGGTPDAGGGEPDAGGGVCGSVAGATGFPQLPASCGMRCLQSSLQTAQMCPEGDTDCFVAALEADPTPAASLDVGGGMTQQIDCIGCFNWQATSCVAESCPTEFNAWADCLGTAADPDTECADEDAAINACIDASTTFSNCYQMRAPVCLRVGSTFAPSFSPSTIPTPSSAQIRASLAAYATTL